MPKSTVKNALQRLQQDNHDVYLTLLEQCFRITQLAQARDTATLPQELASLASTLQQATRTVSSFKSLSATTQTAIRITQIAVT